jgi:predicted transcriptional regulator
MAERYNTEQQKQFCANWQSSGMSKQDFCKANNISKSGLYKWLNVSPQKFHLCN